MSKQSGPGPKTRFVDRPEVIETFADSIRAITFDAQTMRIEFCVSRMDEPNPPKPPTSRQYPACRLVLTPNAALVLFNKLRQIMNAMEKSGAIKKEMHPPKTVH